MEKPLPTISYSWDSEPRESPRSLSAAIEKIDLALMMVVDPDYQWFRDILGEAEAFDDIDRLKASLTAKLPKLNGPDTPLRNCIADAWVALVGAERCATEGDVESAWEHVSMAQSALNSAEASFEALYVERHRITGAINGARGGEKLKARADRVKRKCEDLLRAKRPPNGWRGIDVAVKDVATDLDEFLKTLGAGHESELWITKLDEWLGKPGLIRDAYDGKGPEAPG